MTEGREETSEPLVTERNGERQAILGYTWPGIEVGEPPIPAYTFFEYVESIRHGTLEDFKRIQDLTKEWWFPTLDRGAGALLHFAVDHGRLDMIKYLIEEIRVPVNQLSLNHGWTPLHRCARLVHYTHAPFFDIFECLLASGADPAIKTKPNDDYVESMLYKDCTAFDLVVEKGYGWELGVVREKVAKLIASYSHVKVQPAWTYSGPPMGETAHKIMNAWRSLPPLYPPDDWPGIIPPGFEGSQGMKLYAV